MANEITLTQLSGVAPDWVRATALIARFARSVVVPVVLNADKDVARKGDRVSLTIMPKLSVNAVGSGGTVTRQQVSTSSVEIVVNRWAECTVDVEDLAQEQAAIDVLSSYGEQMGDALAEDQDKQLLALYSNLTTNTLGGNFPLDDAQVRLARLKLDRLDVPDMDRTYILHPDNEADLLSLARFSEAQNTGFSRGLQVDGGRLKGLYGIPVRVTSRVNSLASLYQNLLLHREAFGIATQKNFKIVKLAKVQLSEAISGHILFGVKTVRETHGALIQAAANP